MRVAMTGATGFIGRELCAALLRDGHQVVALTREPQRAQAVLPGAEVAAWGDAPAALPAVDAVVNLAGESVAGRWSEAKKRRMRDSRIAGTRRLVAAIEAAAARPAVLVSASAVGYYGDRGEEMLTEASSAGSDFLAQLCQDWEAEARRTEALGLRVALLRLGVVLDRNGGALAQMLTPFRLGAGGPLGSGRQWFPWAHRADVVGLFRFALEKPEATGAINAVAPQLVRQGEFAAALGQALRRPAFVPTPAFALRLLFGEFAETLLGGQRVLPERAEALGYSFRFPQLAPALRAILEEAPEANGSPGTPSGSLPTAQG
jgi:uncharacterized protein